MPVSLLARVAFFTIASASLMTEVVHGMHIKDVELFDDFHGAIVNGENFTVSFSSPT